MAQNGPRKLGKGTSLQGICTERNQNSHRGKAVKSRRNGKLRAKGPTEVRRRASQAGAKQQSTTKRARAGEKPRLLAMVRCKINEDTAIEERSSKKRERLSGTCNVKDRHGQVKNTGYHSVGKSGGNEEMCARGRRTEEQHAESEASVTRAEGRGQAANPTKPAATPQGNRKERSRIKQGTNCVCAWVHNQQTTNLEQRERGLPGMPAVVGSCRCRAARWQAQRARHTLKIKQTKSQHDRAVPVRRCQ